MGLFTWDDGNNKVSDYSGKNCDESISSSFQLSMTDGYRLGSGNISFSNTIRIIFLPL